MFFSNIFKIIGHSIKVHHVHSLASHRPWHNTLYPEGSPGPSLRGRDLQNDMPSLLLYPHLHRHSTVYVLFGIFTNTLFTLAE